MSDTFQCLVDVDQETLQQANVASSTLSFFGTFVSVPVIDGEFIQISPTEQITSGKLNGVSDFNSRYVAQECFAYRVCVGSSALVHQHVRRNDLR